MYRPALMYFAARMLVFAACAMVLYLIPPLRQPGNTLLFWMLAVVLSVVVSFFALRPLRDRLSGDIEVAASERLQRLEETRQRERTDEEVEDEELGRR